MSALLTIAKTANIADDCRNLSRSTRSHLSANRPPQLFNLNSLAIPAILAIADLLR
jgi:hypothetical protein